MGPIRMQRFWQSARLHTGGFTLEVMQGPVGFLLGKAWKPRARLKFIVVNRVI